MFGLDESIAGVSDGATLWLVVLVGVLLGLRHAADPDHLAAMTTLIASGKDRAARAAGRLGIAWGLGHATTLFAFGLPIVIYERYLPYRLQQGAETAVAAVIVYLAARLLLRWRAGKFHVHAHEHDGTSHAHLHAHEEEAGHGHPHRARSPLAAYAIGLVHGIGGSAGVSILIVASIESTELAVASLAVLALFTMISMGIVTTGFGVTLSSRPVRRAFSMLAPALGAASLAFGIWYGTAAWSVVPYPF